MNQELDAVIEKKIEEAKAGKRRPRGWVKIDTYGWLHGSVNMRYDLEKKAIFSDLICLAEQLGPVPGLISDNDFRPLKHDFLAHQCCCSVELFEKTLNLGIEDGSIYENSHGIFLVKFDKHQFTEYDRQKPYRERSKLEKDRDYEHQRFGHAVKR